MTIRNLEIACRGDVWVVLDGWEIVATAPSQAAAERIAEGMARDHCNQEPAYPDWICSSCGAKHGLRRCGVCTWHVGTCGICGIEASVTEPRDFGHLREWPLKEVSP
jgi:hypothetical protein